MHYVIAFITALAGLLWALNSLQRSGVDLNAFNPFVWWRRRQLANFYGANPLHVLDNPMEVAALLMLATAKFDGEVSREEKHFLLKTFEEEFHVSAHEASSLLSQASYLLRDETDITAQLEKILERSRSAFTDEQVESTVDLMQRTASLEGPPGDGKLALIGETSRILGAARAQPGKWQQQSST
ncbi:MAG: TerB family tellurite resistance protein [Gammaproteobacteria bacterium]|nr:TerB family tellurite resistance protein [Gammaproteobacteria bacterium]